MTDKKSLEDRINEESIKRFQHEGYNKVFTVGAHFGHSLAMEEVEKEKRLTVHYIVKNRELESQLLTAQKQIEVLREALEMEKKDHYETKMHFAKRENKRDDVIGIFEAALEYYKDCDQYLSEASFGGKKVIQCIDGIDVVAVEALSKVKEMDK